METLLRLLLAKHLTLFFISQAAFLTALGLPVNPTVDLPHQTSPSATKQPSDCTQNGQFTCDSLKGIRDGGRCFFIPNISTNCNDAWKTCADHGGVLAQVHTESEFNKVVDMIVTLNVQGSASLALIWLAMNRDPGYSTVRNCTGLTEHTYWYDDASTKNLAMMAANTWARYKMCDDTDSSPDEPAITIQVRNSVGMFKDGGCTRTDYLVQPLCQIHVFGQNYTKTDICITEKPLETVSGSQLHPQHCANECTKRVWCRSFNFLHDPVSSCSNRTCQLFPWSIYDTCPECAERTSAPANEECMHYNYVP